MANTVITSDNELSKSLGQWLVTYKGFKNGLENFSSLKDGEELVVVAHDFELGTGTPLLEALTKEEYPMTEFKVILIVCSAADLSFGADLLSPAENIANALNRDVLASTTVVYGEWGDGGLTIQGNFITVKPNTDLTSLMQQLTLGDVA